MFGGETTVGTLCASRQFERETSPACIKSKRYTIRFSDRNHTHRPYSYQIFYRNGQGCKHFSHPNILPVVEVSEELFPFCVMTPWMSGGNIMQYIQKDPSANRLMLVIARRDRRGRPTDCVHDSLQNRSRYAACSRSTSVALGMYVFLTSIVRHPCVACKSC